MSTQGIPDTVLRFIFESVDSVEFLEVLLHLHHHRERAWRAQEIAALLRLNPDSVQRRLELLQQLQFCSATDLSDSSVQMQPQSEDRERLLRELVEAYAVRKHSVYSLIFSPLKRMRSFADAFKVGAKKGESDG